MSICTVTGDNCGPLVQLSSKWRYSGNINILFLTFFCSLILESIVVFA